MSRRIAYMRVAPDGLKALSATRPYIESSSIGARLRALVEYVALIGGCLLRGHAFASAQARRQQRSVLTNVATVFRGARPHCPGESVTRAETGIPAFAEIPQFSSAGCGLALIIRS